MRAVIQRVLSARCTVDGRVTGEIGRGLLVFVGVGKNDTERDLMKCADKIANIRIFEDEKGKMSKSTADVGGSVLLISNFTLYGAEKSRRSRKKRRVRRGYAYRCVQRRAGHDFF